MLSVREDALTPGDVVVDIGHCVMEKDGGAV